MILKIIHRELKSSPKFILLFVLNLAIGLMGLAAIEFLKQGFNEELASKSKAILGADLALSSRIKIHSDKEELIRQRLPVEASTKVVSLFSMGLYNGQSKLINIKAMGEGFPYYGKITLLSGNELKDMKDDEIYLYQELIPQMGLKVGELLKIGEAQFKVKDFIADDPGQNMQFGALAPRGYISLEGLERAKLLQKGSTAFYSYYFKLGNKVRDLDKVKEEITKEIDDNAIRVEIPATTSQQVSRVLTYLNDFLGLVSLCGLFLSSFGLIYLFRSFLHERRKEFAIFKFLGLKKSKIFFIYFGELLILGLVGSVIGTLLGLGASPLISTILTSVSGQEVSFSLNMKSVLVVLAIGIGSTLILAPALLLPYLGIDYKILFSFTDEVQKKWRDYFLFLPMVLFYWIVSVYLSNSFIIGSIFVGTFSVLTIIGFPLGNILLQRISVPRSKRPLERKLALTYIVRHRVTTLFVFSSIFLSTFLMILIPTIKSSLEKELEMPTKGNGPSLFLFDIQEEQIGSLTSLAKKYEMGELSLSPMVSARLISINGEILKTDTKEALTREEQREVRMRNRGVNLTFRNTIGPSEILIEGRLPHSYSPEDPFAEVTLEQNYASRIGAKLNDMLLFDILDIPIKAKVVGLRQVRWTSFLPNFFINFGPGVLEDAPKTYLMALSNPKDSDINAFQSETAKDLSNVSVIDVKRVVDKISGIIESMSKILLIMAAVTFVAGLLVVFSLISHQARTRAVDISLYKILGLKGERISRILNEEILIQSFLGVLAGVTMSLVMAFTLSRVIFKSTFSFNTLEISIISLTILAVIYFINSTVVSRIVTKKVHDVFSDL